MNIRPAGRWHLGSVPAACLASVGHRVVGLNADPAIIPALSTGHTSIAEPHLDDLVQTGGARGRPRCATDAYDAPGGAEVVWVAYDTHGDEEKRADPQWVEVRYRTVDPLSRVTRRS